jgi:hypothetical protein
MIRRVLQGAWLVALAAACGGTTGTTDAGVGGASVAGAAGSSSADAGGPAGNGGDAGSGGGAGTERDAGAGGDASVVVPQGPVDKVDLLFMIDNSISMSDKQQLLQAVASDLVSRLTNPLCVDASGQLSPAPAEPGGACPPGQARQFSPIADIHVGVISSSLGDVGANVACPQSGFDGYAPERIDLAHLVGSLERGQGTANTDQGFLAWRPGATGDVQVFDEHFASMLLSVGENGCGWEASLESWYRFLVDPFPYQSLVRVPCPGSSSSAPNCVQQATTPDDRIQLDTTLLAQRAAFLRPDSLVAIVLLTDENDCSLSVGSQNWVVASIDDTRPMFRGSSACASDANAKCCYSCPLGPPSGCVADPICNEGSTGDNLQNRLPAAQDGKNLRCYQQKRRFGVDFLYPTRRYVNALQQPELCWNDPELSTEACAPGNIVANPLYAQGRSPSRVFLAGIVGVPWQEIASDVDAEGRPLPLDQLRFRNAAELESQGTWARILGSPGVAWRAATEQRPEVLSVPAVAPTSPFMVESDAPRAGVAPGNDINGREFDTSNPATGASDTPDDLEYACIFPLATPRDCAQRDPATQACDCYADDLNRPLCEQTPGVSTPGTVQYWGKAYPAGRQLEVLRGYGNNSILASICARNVVDPSAADYAYRPALSAILERLSEQLP